ncbi:hypothetical protein PG996_008167 [Apiospora saccharicola]|uniref:Uncharacterized protein n=1 Tax=Apiospora saccharicola TaxID=335842 RepID=A0ABR1UZN1_9PEZI
MSSWFLSRDESFRNVACLFISAVWQLCPKPRQDRTVIVQLNLCGCCPDFQKARSRMNLPFQYQVRKLLTDTQTKTSSTKLLAQTQINLYERLKHEFPHMLFKEGLFSN